MLGQRERYPTDAIVMIHEAMRTHTAEVARPVGLPACPAATPLPPIPMNKMMLHEPRWLLCISAAQSERRNATRRTLTHARCPRTRRGLRTRLCSFMRGGAADRSEASRSSMTSATHGEELRPANCGTNRLHVPDIDNTLFPRGYDGLVPYAARFADGAPRAGRARTTRPTVATFAVDRPAQLRDDPVVSVCLLPPPDGSENARPTCSSRRTLGAGCSKAARDPDRRHAAGRAHVQLP